MQADLPRTRPEAETSAAHPGASTLPHRRFRPVPRARLPWSDWNGLYAGEPETCRRSLRQFLPILTHLGLLAALFKVYNLEGAAFQTLAFLCVACVPVHYLLPLKAKRPFLLAASALGLGLVFGPAVAAAAVGLAAVFVAILSLPIGWTQRAVIAGGIGLVLSLGRAGVLNLPVPSPGVFWPVAASLLMFRLIILFYEQKHAKSREPVLDALSYFLLLPNACFIHFPVVDYRTFLRGYFSADIHQTQRRGLSMMLKGAVHLLLYRLIYHRLLITPEEVHNVGTLAAYLFCNYLLYLRVSGQFHLACGMLHLFGHHLPETHHHYLLANSFTDYWRRINIYWKDFMVRVVFNPVVFRLKKWPQTQSLAIATFTVFMVTWLLHGYQLFWLRGSWGFSVPDALFWGILGALVMINVQIDARKPRTRTLKSREARPSLKARALNSLKVAGTLLTITLLWSLWSSESLSAWLDMLRRAMP